LDGDGNNQEKIFDVAWSGERTANAAGKLPPVGSSADIRTGKTTNEIGAEQLTTVWQDPQFDASSPAVYYVRVLQIPTVRHSQLDAIALGIETVRLKTHACTSAEDMAPIGLFSKRHFSAGCFSSLAC
jgi:hypothetical protein